MPKSISQQFKVGLRKVLGKFEDSVNELKNPAIQKPIADFLLSLIIKRTKLGYGVEQNFGQKYKLPKHSTRYVDLRKKSQILSGSSSGSKSNLTFTGQLLESTKVIKATNGQIVISPTGSRSNGLSNLELADILANNHRNGKKYSYNRVSQLEYNQLIRFYRRTFGDLLSKRKLLR